MDADLRDAEGAAFEYHRRYADLQIDLTGGEYLGWASEGKDEGAFDETADCGFKSAPDHWRHDAGRWPFRHLLPRRAAINPAAKRPTAPT